MHSISDNIEIMINDKAFEVVEELFESLINRYKNILETLIKSSEFVFDYLHLLYYKYHNIRGGSYIDSPGWIKNKSSTMNLINKKDNNCFQYAVIVGSNHEKIRKQSGRTTNIKPFKNKYK